MNRPDDPGNLLREWELEEGALFEGWDFSRLEGRRIEETPPWSYLEMARTRMQEAESALDLGTGGGEKLLELRDAWPKRLAVTEGYEPNFKLARQRLQPLGVQVVRAEGSLNADLPFADGEFDLVIDRHEAFNAREVARVLRRGGILLTQQVDGSSGSDLMAEFGAKPQWPFFTMEFATGQVREAGLAIEDARQWTGKVKYRDVGAIVYYLKAAPWEVEGFSVRKHRQQLQGLQRRLEREGELAFTEKLLIIQARKP